MTGIEIHCDHCVKYRADLEFWRKEAIRIAVAKAAGEMRFDKRIRHLEYWMGVAAEHSEAAHLELMTAIKTGEKLYGS